MSAPFAAAHFILYVREQRASTDIHARALAAGATELSPPAPRDWGHEASYLRDPDGHVLAFARLMA